jgi:cysteine synthase A
VGAATKESYKKSLDLCRVGLLAGPSSGFALAGLLRFLGEHHDLDRFRNSDGEVMASFICCDTPFPYLDKYSTILDPEDFAKPARTMGKLNGPMFTSITMAAVRWSLSG